MTTPCHHCGWPIKKDIVEIRISKWHNGTEVDVKQKFYHPKCQPS